MQSQSEMQRGAVLTSQREDPIRLFVVKENRNRNEDVSSINYLSLERQLVLAQKSTHE